MLEIRNVRREDFMRMCSVVLGVCAVLVDDDLHSISMQSTTN